MDRFLHEWGSYDNMISNGCDPKYIRRLGELARSMSKDQPVEFEQRSYMHGARWAQKLAGAGGP
eukprot:11108353-Karenia_brevis.AAC.1